MRYRELKCSLSKEIAEDFTNFLDILQTEGYYEILFDSYQPKKENEGILRENTTINVYLSENDLEKELKIYIFLKTQGKDFFIESRIVETKEFEEAYKEFYKPFVIGKKFVVIPTWEKDSQQAKNLLETFPNSLPLYMNPGLAFGTGHHETTQLMLSQMTKILKPNMKVLDIGTGSGILSIGAALLEASFILAIDIDPNAIKATQYNWSENHFSNKINFLLKEGSFDHSEIYKYNYDLVLANITYAVISQNIKHIAEISSKIFLFSGIILEKKQEFLELLSKHIEGELSYFDELNEWIILEWNRK